MNLYRKRLDFAFLIGLFCTLFIPTLFPEAKLLYFVPFLIIMYYKKTFLTCLWGSLFCGLILDLLSSESRLGLYAINYMLTTTLIYQLRHNFFPDSAITLPVLTLFFSMLSALLEIIMMMVFDHRLTLHGHWIFNTMIYLPILNALFAFVIFVIPSILFGKKQLRGTDYFTSC
jgi:cell shape-determining protein MreD